MYHLSIPFPCQVQVKDYEETLCMKGTEEFIIVLEMYPGPGLWPGVEGLRRSGHPVLSCHLSELMSTNYWLQSLAQVLQGCHYLLPAHENVKPFFPLSWSTLTESFPWRLTIEKIRKIFQISSDLGVEVFLVQCFDQFSCTWHYCHESSMASGFQGQSLYFAHTLNSQVSRRLLRVSSSLLPLGRGKSSSFIHGWFKWSN